MGCGTSRDTTGHVTGNSQLPVFSNPLYVDVDTAWDIANKSIEVKKVGAMEKKLVVKRRGWKTVRIFVSSTFKDFQHEREVLVKKVCIALFVLNLVFILALCIKCINQHKIYDVRGLIWVLDFGLLKNKWTHGGGRFIEAFNAVYNILNNCCI